MTPRRVLFSLVLLAATLLSLGACGHSPPTQYVTLDAVPGTPTGYRGPAIRVPAVRIPPELDRDEFVQRGAAGELKVDDFVRWSAPLGRLARNTLILDLSSRLPSGKVSPPDAPAQSTGRRIDVAILALDVADGAASMQVAYEFAADDGQAPATSRQWKTLHIAVAGRTAPETARAFSALLGELADGIATDLAARP